jgi:hypothetical protein
MIKADASTVRAVAIPLTLVAGGFLALSSHSVIAKPASSAKASAVSKASTSKASTSKASTSKVSASKTSASNKGAARKVAQQAKLKPLPRYLPMHQIKQLQSARSNVDWSALSPLLNGAPMPKWMKALPGAQPYSVPLPKLAANKPKTRANAQQFPRPIPPAPVRTQAARPVVPRWVRYPLEFQLAGIGIGTRAVDKDRFNRIDRYGLFAMHGNPTAVVVPAATAAGGAAAGITVQQQPPEVASLFPSTRDGGLPDWASAITVALDNNHVQWLYKRETYSMGFVVDRLGFVDAIVVAGISSPIARTQLEDPVHTIKLGDDLRKVLFRYGYPDTIETYTVAVAGAGVATTPAAGAGGEGAGGEGAAPEGAPPTAPPPGSGAPGSSEAGAGGEGAAGGAVAGNSAFRTFEIRYEQSYNVVFTIRNNRVVRIYIFGDPDFFNDRRRRQFRVSY